MISNTQYKNIMRNFSILCVESGSYYSEIKRHNDYLEWKKKSPTSSLTAMILATAAMNVGNK